MSEIIKPVNSLKEKVGSGGFSELDLQVAQKIIEENNVDFRPIAFELFREIESILKLIKSSGEKQNAFLSLLQDPIMKLRGQGALFKYPSISKISDIVIDLLDEEKAIDEDTTKILSAYKIAGWALLSQEIKDTENEVFKSLFEEIKDLCSRYRNKKTQSLVL